MKGRKAERARRRRLLIIALLLFIPAVIAPAAVFVWQKRLSPEARATRLRAKAILDMSVNRPEDAVAKLEEAAAIAPLDVRVLIELADARRARRDRRGGIAALEKACAIDEDAIDARLRLGWYTLEVGDTARAKDVLRWLDDPAHASRVLAYSENIALFGFQFAWMEGDATGAIRRADTMLRDSPRSRSGLFARARAALAVGDTDTARRAMSRLLEDAGADPGPHVLMSRACEEAGDELAALAALDGPPSVTSSAEVILRRAEILCARATPEAASAIEALGASLPESADAARSYISGLAAAAREDWGGALALCRKALALDARLVEARVEMADALAHRRDFEGARAELSTVLGENPLLRRARLALARVKLEAGDVDGAAADATRLLSLSTRDYEAAWVLLGARARQGRLADASQYFDALAAKEPGHPVAEVARALTKLATLDLDSAAEGGERLLSESTGGREALESFVDAAAARRRVVETMLKLVASIPPDLRGVPRHIELAARFQEIGRYDEAAAELRTALSIDRANVDALRGLATLAEARGDRAGAAAAARDCLARGPDVGALAILARCLLESRDSAGALAVAEPFILTASAAPRTGSTPTPEERQERQLVTSLARTGFSAAVGLGDLPRAERLMDAMALEVTRTAVERAAAAFSLGLYEDGRERLASRLADPRAASVRDPDAEWIGSLIDVARGDTQSALVRIRRSAIAGSLLRAAGAIDVLVAAGARREAIAVAERAAMTVRPAEGPTAPGTPLSLRPGPVGRAMIAWARRATPEQVQRIQGPFHRLLVAGVYGHRVVVRRLAPEMRAAEMTADPLVPLLVARVLEEAGDAGAARDLLEAARTANPDSLEVLEALGAYLVAHGETSAAARLLLRAATVSPADATIRAFIGLDGERKSDPTGMIAAERGASRVAGARGSDQSVDLAWLYARDANLIDECLATVAPRGSIGVEDLLVERLSRALSSLARARAVSPAEPFVRLHLGRAYRRMGRLEAARRELEAVITLAPESRDGIAAAIAREEVLRGLSGGHRPGATYEEAYTLELGTSAQESLGPLGAQHVFRMDLPADARIQVDFTGADDALTQLAFSRHLGRASAPLKTSAVPPGAEARWVLDLARGSYSVEVVAVARPSISAYRLALSSVAGATPPGEEREPDDSAEEAQALAPGMALRAALGPLTDIDMFRIPQPPGGGIVDLHVRAPARCDIVVRLVHSGVLSNSVPKSFTVPAGGSVRIPGLDSPGGGTIVEVTGPPGAASPYEISVALRPARPETLPRLLAEPDDEPSAAFVVPSPAERAPPLRLAGTIEPAGDRDLVRLPLARVAVALRAPPDIDLLIDVLETSPDGGLAVRKTFPVARGTRGAMEALGGGPLIAVRAASPRDASASEYLLEVEGAEKKTP